MPRASKELNQTIGEMVVSDTYLVDVVSNPTNPMRNPRLSPEEQACVEEGAKFINGVLEGDVSRLTGKHKETFLASFWGFVRTCLNLED